MNEKALKAANLNSKRKRKSRGTQNKYTDKEWAEIRKLRHIAA